MSRIKDRYNVTQRIRSGEFYKMRKQHYTNLRYCQVCGKEFKTARYHTKTCSPRCRKKLQRQDPTWIEPRDRNLT